ncbi:MAG: YlmH/Sll1252 family protein [Lachnospiraceae bacterium]
MKSEKDELIFKRKLIEAAKLAYECGIAVTSDFLGLAEQNLFHEIQRELPAVGYTCFGGVPGAERFCIRFDGTVAVSGLTQLELTEEIAAEYPISCIRVSPSAPKYSEELSHRDYLGSLLSLGVNRSKTGDIYLRGEIAFVFCTDNMADFLCREWLQVKHTQIHCETVVPDSEALLAPTLQEITGTVPSLRLDALIAAAFQTSRSSLTNYIEAGKVFINGRMIMKPGVEIKEKDVVSIRGKGRFFLDEVRNTTKKGRIVVVIQKYM